MHAILIICFIIFLLVQVGYFLNYIFTRETETIVSSVRFLIYFNFQVPIQIIFFFFYEFDYLSFVSAFVISWLHINSVLKYHALSRKIILKLFKNTLEIKKKSSNHHLILLIGEQHERFSNDNNKNKKQKSSLIFYGILCAENSSFNNNPKNKWFSFINEKKSLEYVDLLHQN